jgi:hypothetical protein
MTDKVQNPNNPELYTIVRTISNLHDSEPSDFILTENSAAISETISFS